jgi:hypothetical protein
MKPRWIGPVGVAVLIPVFIIFLKADQEKPWPGEDVTAVLLRLHHEVLAMGPYPGDDFIHQQFFTGKDDDDDTNKDVYVGILIQPGPQSDRMEIRVTRMARNPRDPQISTAVESRFLTCRVAGRSATVVSSEFGAEEIPIILQDLLKAVLQKKELLIRRGQVLTFDRFDSA